MLGRIDNPDKVTEKNVLSAKGAWGLPTIQFSEVGQSKRLLKSINALCKIFGSRLPIRFYGHYQNDFDASVLNHLPDVQWLFIDCLQNISNSDAIFQLPKLKKLSFGVYNYENPDFLNQLNLQELEQLTIGETKKRNIDLALLAKAEKIHSLSIIGHTKNINEVGHMQSLQDLTLNLIGKKNGLEFASKIAKLNSLKIMLGGRQNINEVSHPLLQELQIIRVRGFNNIGDLSRFPRLQRLHLRCSRTALDYDKLSEFSWPENMQTVALYSGNKKQDDIRRKRLDVLGLKEFS